MLAVAVTEGELVLLMVKVSPTWNVVVKVVLLPVTVAEPALLLTVPGVKLFWLTTKVLPGALVLTPTRWLLVSASKIVAVLPEFRICAAVVFVAATFRPWPLLAATFKAMPVLKLVPEMLVMVPAVVLFANTFSKPLLLVDV